MGEDGGRDGGLCDGGDDSATAAASGAYEDVDGVNALEPCSPGQAARTRDSGCGLRGKVASRGLSAGSRTFGSGLFDERCTRSHLGTVSTHWR